MWVSNILHLKKNPPIKFNHWMLKPNNLGQSLRKVCETLSLKIIEQTFNQAFPDEINLLETDESTKNDFCYVRHITLEGDDIPFTYGRVVVPKHVYLKHMDKFNGLGNKLIGETLLYGNPHTTRSDFEYNELNNNHPLYNLIISTLPSALRTTEPAWARRSVFTINKDEKILITEVFLNNIPDFID